MKPFIYTLALAGLFCCTTTAQEPTAQETTSTAAAVPAVPARLQEMQYISAARPAADAKFYIYLSSASWCPPCRAIMPKIVEQYHAIKAAGGEIILLCFDRTPQAGAAYVKKYNAEFPAVMADFRSAIKLGLPGYVAPRGIPNVTFVTPDGQAFHNGFGGTLLDWQTIITK